MISVVVLICMCVAAASSKPVYVVPSSYPTNYPTPYFGHFRSVHPFQYVSGEFPTPVVTNPETLLRTPVIAQPIVPTFRTSFTPYSAYTPVTRYQTQNTDGSYTFGYSGGPSSRAETRDKFGRVEGVFNYIDPVGKVQTQKYTADNQGFRVAGTNLPVAPFTKTEETDTNVVTVNRIKRDATAEYQTPANTVPLKQVTDVLPKIVVPNTVVPEGRSIQTYPFGFPYNAYPTYYTVPTTYTRDNTITGKTPFPAVPVPTTYTASVPFPTTYQSNVPVPTPYTATFPFDNKVVPFATNSPVTYTNQYPFFTYTPTTGVDTTKTDVVTGKSQPIVYSGNYPYNYPSTFNPTTGFVPNFNYNVEKPTTGYTFYY